MSSGNIAEYRRKARECLTRAKTTRATEVKMLWLTLAQDWQLLADHIEKNDARNARNLVSDRAA
jgi:hypothetical protein